MPSGRALSSIVRECSLSVHEYHWPIVGQNTGRHTSFGTRGSQVQILPPRPLLSQKFDPLRQRMRQSFAGRRKNTSGDVNFGLEKPAGGSQGVGWFLTGTIDPVTGDVTVLLTKLTCETLEHLKEWREPKIARLTRLRKPTRNRSCAI